MPSKESPVTEQAAHNRVPLEQGDSSGGRKEEGNPNSKDGVNLKTPTELTMT